MVKSTKVTHAYPVSQETPVLEVPKDQQSDFHPTFSNLGDFKENHADIKKGFQKSPLNQDMFVAKFLQNDYDKPNLEDVVNKITSLTEA